MGDAIKSGFKGVSFLSSVKIITKNGVEVARISNNIMTFRYSGFGGDIITTPGKTTTIIG
ncbi:MAG: hypothetical protein ACJAQ7_002076 [Sediminicola sp.]